MQSTLPHAEVQNEVIETLAEIVRENVAQECKEVELFTLMMDGTSDSKLRYWDFS